MQQQQYQQSPTQQNQNILPQKINYPNIQNPYAQQPYIQQPNIQQPYAQYPNIQYPNIQQPNIQYPYTQQPKIQQTDTQQPTSDLHFLPMQQNNAQSQPINIQLLFPQQKGLLIDQFLQSIYDHKQYMYLGWYDQFRIFIRTHMYMLYLALFISVPVTLYNGFIFYMAQLGGQLLENQEQQPLKKELDLVQYYVQQKHKRSAFFWLQWIIIPIVLWIISSNYCDELYNQYNK